MCEWRDIVWWDDYEAVSDDLQKKKFACDLVETDPCVLRRKEHPEGQNDVPDLFRFDREGESRRGDRDHPGGCA